ACVRAGEGGQSHRARGPVGALAGRVDHRRGARPARGLLTRASRGAGAADRPDTGRIRAARLAGAAGSRTVRNDGGTAYPAGAARLTALETRKRTLPGSARRKRPKDRTDTRKSRHERCRLFRVVREACLKPVAQKLVLPIRARRRLSARRSSSLMPPQTPAS